MQTRIRPIKWVPGYILLMITYSVEPPYKHREKVNDYHLTSCGVNHDNDCHTHVTKSGSGGGVWPDSKKSSQMNREGMSCAVLSNEDTQPAAHVQARVSFQVVICSQGSTVAIKYSTTSRGLSPATCKNLQS